MLREDGYGKGIWGGGRGLEKRGKCSGEQRRRGNRIKEKRWGV